MSSVAEQEHRDPGGDDSAPREDPQQPPPASPCAPRRAHGGAAPRRPPATPTAAPRAPRPAARRSSPSPSLPSADAAEPDAQPERGEPEGLLALARRQLALDGRRLLADEDPQQPVREEPGAADGHSATNAGAPTGRSTPRWSATPPATPATSRPAGGGAAAGPGRAGEAELVTVSSSHGPRRVPSGSESRFLRVSPDVRGAPARPALDHERFGRAQHAAGDVGTRPARPREGRQIAGVSAAIARRYDIDPVLVRVGFVVAAFYGIGAALYIAGWVLLPDEPVPAINSGGAGRRRCC